MLGPIEMKAKVMGQSGQRSEGQERGGTRGVRKMELNKRRHEGENRNGLKPRGAVHNIQESSRQRKEKWSMTEIVPLVLCATISPH